MLRVMKKVPILAIRVVIFVFALITIFSLYPQQIQAFDYSGCQCDDPGMSPNFSCTGHPDLVCEKHDDGHVCFSGGNGKNGYIEKEPGSAMVEEVNIDGVHCTNEVDRNWTNCKCIAEGPGKERRFTCDVPGVAGQVEDGCQREGSICVDRTDTDGHENKSVRYGRDVDLHGVACTSFSDVPNGDKDWWDCSCDTPGEAESGKNGFTCKRTGDNGPAVHDYCEKAEHACKDEPSGDPHENNNQRAGDAVNLHGVVCAGVEDEPLPPPPSPPCKRWVNGQCQTVGTAVGDLATDPAGFIRALFAVLLSVSGGLALLLIIRAGYQMMTSQGKPEQINQARDQLVAAIVGLAFLIFSFVLLQVIGYDILRIPGFGQ
jgi:type IV secretion system pilin